MYKIKLSHSKTSVADDMDILIIESLGEEYAHAGAEPSEPVLDKSALTEIIDDDIDIIELPYEYEDESSDSTKV